MELHLHLKSLLLVARAHLLRDKMRRPALLARRERLISSFGRVDEVADQKVRAVLAHRHPASWLRAEIEQTERAMFGMTRREAEAMLVDAPYGRPGDSRAEAGDSLNYLLQTSFHGPDRHFIPSAKPSTNEVVRA